MHYSVQPAHYDEPSQIERQITQIILSNIDRSSVLQKIARAIAEFFHADGCLIAAVASHQASPHLALWCNDSISSQLIQGQQSLWAILAANTESLVIVNSQISNDEPRLSLLGIKTWFHSCVNGMIVLGREQAWSESDKQLIELMSEWVAMAISQVQLQRQVETIVQHQNLLNQLTLAIRNAWEIDRILQLAITGTAQALQVERGSILLLKSLGSLPLKKHSKGLPKAKVTIVSLWPTISQNSDVTFQQQNSHTLLNYSFCLSDCYWSQQAFSNAPAPFVIPDRRTYGEVNSVSGLECLSSPEAMPALLIVPLENQGSVLGFLVLQHHQPRTWQPEELELVNCVSAQASTAIIQNQTLRQVQALVKERTVQLESILDVQAKLYEKSRQQIDQLRHLNQIKDEFLNNVQHELRTPLTSMIVAIRLLRQPSLPAEIRNRYLDILEQQCSQEIDLINDLLALQQLQYNNSSIQVEDINLKPLLRNLGESFKRKWIDRGLTLQIDVPKRAIPIQTDVEILKRILLELLTNAGKYSHPDTTVHLRATQQVNQQGSQVVLSLSNIGPGISPAEISYIFDKFRRGKGATEQAIQGTGLGLALVKCLVQHLNGIIDVKSCPTENTAGVAPGSQSYETCFTLTLPQFFDSSKV